MTALPGRIQTEALVSLGRPARGAALSGEDLARLSGPGLRAFFEIGRKWGLSTEEQKALLDQEARSTFFEWKKDASRARLGRDQLERISHVLGIYKALRILFPDPKAADAWVKKPNEAYLFEGRPALELMLAGGIPGLLAVRNYLDAQRGGWA